MPEPQEVQFSEGLWNMRPVTSSHTYQSDDGDGIIMGWSPAGYLGLNVSHRLKMGPAEPT